MAEQALDRFITSYNLGMRLVHSRRDRKASNHSPSGRSQSLTDRDILLISCLGNHVGSRTVSALTMSAERLEKQNKERAGGLWIEGAMPLEKCR